VPLGPTFLPTMQDFLSGKLPAQTSYELPLGNAKLNTMPLSKP